MFHHRLILIISVLLLIGAGCSVTLSPDTDSSSNTTDATPAIRQSEDFIVETRNISSRAYTIFRQPNPSVHLTLSRPEKDDESVLLSVPGTYSSPKDTVEGWVVLNGEVIQAKERQGWDGAVIFQDGQIEIIQTNRGKLLTRDKLAEIAKQGSSLIQVHLLVLNGSAQHFKDQPLTKRRALVLFDDGTPAVVESKSLLDLNDFAKDLSEMGVESAVNLDMGAWSEGWYRDPETGKIVTIGFKNETTKRQTNWIYFQK